MIARWEREGKDVDEAYRNLVEKRKRRTDDPISGPVKIGGVVHRNATAASIELDVGEATLRRYIKGRRTTLKTGDGRSLKIDYDFDPDSAPPSARMGTAPVPVRVDGVDYESMSEASEACGGSVASISHCLATGRPSFTTGDGRMVTVEPLPRKIDEETAARREREAEAKRRSRERRAAKYTIFGVGYRSLRAVQRAHDDISHSMFRKWNDDCEDLEAKIIEFRARERIVYKGEEFKNWRQLALRVKMTATSIQKRVESGETVEEAVEGIRAMQEKKREASHGPVKIDGVVYASKSDACRELDIPITSLRTALDQRLDTLTLDDGRSFALEHDFEFDEDSFAMKAGEHSMKAIRVNGVDCESQTQAAEECDVSVSWITWALKSGKKRHVRRGRARVIEIESLAPKDSGPKKGPLKRTRPERGKNCIVVFDIKYPSLPALARAYPRINRNTMYSWYRDGYDIEERIRMFDARQARREESPESQSELFDF